MRQETFVTIILPVYNADKFVNSAIKSILKQTHSNFELIIFDDGSSDQSREIINSFKDPRIKKIFYNTNQGLIHILNEGLNISKGKYITRMDSDDIALPNRIEKQVDFLENNLDIGVCGSFARVISQEGELLNIWKMPSNHNDIKANLLEGAVLCHPTIMFRKKSIKGIYYSKDWRHAEDYELWTRLINKTKFHVLPEILLYYRNHPQQVSSEYYNLQKSLMCQLTMIQLELVGVDNYKVMDNIYHFLTGTWQKVNIKTLKEDWSIFNSFAIKKGYSPISLRKLFTKRLFYFFADKKHISSRDKIHFLINYWQFILTWNIAKTLHILLK